MPSTRTRRSAREQTRLQPRIAAARRPVPRNVIEPLLNPPIEYSGYETGLDKNNEPPAEENDPRNVKQPFSPRVHEDLQRSWNINNGADMCFVFDKVSPARRFKRGMVFDEEQDFPDCTEEDAGNITETDGDTEAWMPYMPDEYL